MLYVNPDDFNASDLVSNNGNSPTRPFKTIQRALLEVARFSYIQGQNNDKYDQFTINLSPGEYISLITVLVKQIPLKFLSYQINLTLTF